MIRPLPRDVGAALDDLAAPLAPQFPDRAAFFDWQAGITAAIATGRITGLATNSLEAVLLYQEQGGLATILAGLGATDDAFLEACFDALQADLAALIWDEWVGPDWPTRLSHRGVRPYELQTRVQDLARVPHEPLPPELGIRPWRPDDVDAMIPVIAAANAGRLAGVFLAYPSAPSAAAHEASIRAMLAGAKGRFVPEASFVAEQEGKLVGVVLGVLQAGDAATLFELAAYPHRQLGRYLVRAMQQAWRELGHGTMTFFTTADNAAVHRLYQEDEILSCAVTRGAYWLRGT